MLWPWTTRHSGNASMTGGADNHILCLGRLDRHQRIVELLCEQANAAIDEQLRASMGNVKSTKLPNGIIMNVLDVENFAHKFTFLRPARPPARCTIDSARSMPESRW